MGLQSLALRVLAVAGLALVLFLAGMWAGHSAATTQADARQAKTAAAQLKRYQAQVVEGEAAAGALREQLGLQGRYTATLQERARHAAPLTVPPAAVAAPQACAGAALLTDSAAVGGHSLPAHPPAGTANDPGAAAADDPGVGLTLAAVSLWNSALAQHDVPAGACRADALTSPACAAESGAELADAWRNHAANAASCAADRARHQGLIDFLAGRQK